MDDRLYRSVDDRMLAGVAGGVAERLDADPSIIRVVWALLVVLTGGIALVAYVIMAVVVPERPGGSSEEPLWQPVPGAGPAPDAPPAGNVTPDPDAPTAATAFVATGLTATTSAGAASTGPDGPAAVNPPAAPPGGPPAAAGGWVAPDGRTVARAAGPTRSRRQRSGSGRGDDRGALIGGLVLILIGGFFLLRQFIPAIDLGSWWPLILVGIGVVLVIISLRPDRTSG